MLVGYLGSLCWTYEQIGLLNTLWEWNSFVCRGLTVSQISLKRRKPAPSSQPGRPFSRTPMHPATPNSKPRCSCPPDPLKSVVLTQPLGGLCSTLHFVGRSLPSLFEVSSLMAGRWHCWIRSSNSWICSFIHLLIYSTLKTEWVNEQIHKARLSYPLQYSWAPLVAQLVKNPPAT